MTLTPRARRVALTAHVTASVGWLGAVGAFLALAIAGLVSHDAPTVRAAYPSMELIGWYVIVPASIAALLTGLIQSLGTEWGLVRHHWVLTKFVLTIGATILLLLHMQPVKHAADIAAAASADRQFHSLQVRLIVDAALALLVLFANTALSVFKPWGMTRYGRRHQLPDHPGQREVLRRQSAVVLPWPYGLVVIGVLLLIVLLHLTGVVGHH